MNTEANNGIIGGGFKLDAAGKMRLNGKMIDKATSAMVEAGSIITGFSMADLKKAKQKKAASGGKTIEEQLADISPAIALLKVGMTAKLDMPKGDVIRKGKGGVEKKLDPKRSFVMSIVTKLNSLTAKEGTWEGRVFDSASDDEGNFMYVSRLPDTDSPPVRKAPTGRKAGTTNGSAASNSLSAALEASRQHLDGKKDEGGEKVEANGGDKQDADAILNGGVAETTGNEPQLEQAQVITH